MSFIKSIARKAWGLLTRVARSARKPGGINDEALPSGFIAPYRKGSRHVRNLGHIDF